MFLIVGLGNTGEQYEKTYHNIGFLAMDKLASTLTLTSRTLKLPQRWSFHTLSYETHKNDEYTLVKPQGYMNESGMYVTPLIKHFSITPDHLIIIHDDSDMRMGTYKLKFGGSSGGHRGIESLIEHLGTQDFWHLRIGIRPEHDPLRIKAEKLVLQHIRKEDQDTIDHTIDQALKHLQEELKKTPNRK